MTEQLEGRALDRAIAEVRGWKPCPAWHPARMPHPLMGPGARHEADECPNDGDGSLCMMQTEPSAEQFRKPPPFNTSPEWTVWLLEEMRAMYDVEIDAEGGPNLLPPWRDLPWRVQLFDSDRPGPMGTEPIHQTHGPTIALAVARAWLAWAQAKTPAGEGRGF